LDTDLFGYIKIIVRWSWVILLLVASTMAVIYYSAANAPLVYRSTVKLEVSAPEPEEVTLYTTVRTGAAREEIGAVQSNFAQIVRTGSVAVRTLQTLGLAMSWQDLQNRISVEIPAFSDFVYVHVEADNPTDAEALARTLVDVALKYYGEARAKTTVVRKQFILEQLQIATSDLTTARDALLRFQVKYGTADLSRDIQTYQDTLRTLRLDRDRNLVEIERLNAAAAYFTASAQKATSEGDSVAAASYRQSSTSSLATADGLRAAVIRLNEIIAQKENELLSLVALTAEYNRLQADVRQAENIYTFLQSKLTEAQIKENDAKGVGFIQIIEPAQVPSSPLPVRTRSMVIPGLAASLIGGVILAFALEYVFGLPRRRRARAKDREQS